MNLLAQLAQPSWPPLVPPFLSTDPKAALDMAERAQTMAQRDLYSALFVTSLVFIGALALWIVKLHYDLRRVNDARVEEQRESKRELALALDKHTEALTMMLREAQARAKRVRASDTPGRIPEGTQS